MPPVFTKQIPTQIIVLLSIMAVIELLLTMADTGLFGDIKLRGLFFAYGAFWDPLLDGELEPIFCIQPIYMFLTHAFLHGGLLHFIMNSTVLVSLGRFISDQAGPWPVVILFVVAAIAGGMAFGLLADTTAPMIGASGAAFGFIGLWQYWEFRIRQMRKLPLRPVIQNALGLVLLNAVFFFFLQGALAWEAHLGGYLTGLALGPWMTAQARSRARAGN